jgi:phenylalanyl-tRNA synthetase beta chain
MQVSIKWLKDYIDFKESPEEIADKLTMAGVPVENIIRQGDEISKVVTGRVTHMEKHPNSDHMWVCNVDAGQGEEIVIVTGAQNVHAGDVVPVALVGSHLPGGVKISKGKLRGIMSCGMLCSAKELQLDMDKLTDEQKDGIFILPSDTGIGKDIKEVLGLDGVVLEFELTANRADCFSVLGLVREIAVLTDNKPKYPVIEVSEIAEKSSDLVEVEIKAPNLCPRFSAKVLKNIKIAPSPEWMQERLESAGIRSINNVVDVTNFVMVELGQPMHAYDYDTLQGHKLVARRAFDGEKITTLDGNERETSTDTIIIADGAHGVGLAGVMGGLETEVTDNTKNVVLEAASFNGACIRRTSRACGLHSEASGRFERGVDTKNTVRALNRAAQLLVEMGACDACEGFVDVYPKPESAAEVKFTAAEINSRLGTNIPAATIKEILTKLEFKVEENDGEFTAIVPSWRGDVRLMADISEEISRIYGFDNIASTMPSGSMMQGGQDEQKDFVDMAKEILCGVGLNEVLSFSFTHPQTFDKLLVPMESELRNAVPILNPITDEFPLLRTTLVSSVLETVSRNHSRKNEDVRIFEIGTVFKPKQIPLTELPVETIKLCGALTGHRYPHSWSQSREMTDFYDAKGVVEILLDKLGIGKYTVESGEHYAMHPGKTAFFKKGREVIATVGEVHPKVQQNMDIAKKTYLFEMDIKVLMKYSSLIPRYKAVPKYPATSRDLALTVAAEVTAAEVEAKITKSGGKFLSGVTLFDVYTGEQVGEGKKSLAFSLQFQAADKTLTDADVDEPYNKILDVLEKEFGAKLRA